ncbi:MAG: glucosylceramidase [Algoriphagus sp.]|nr:glucosylceramidase [Algoriphagus sp.]
MKGKMLFLFSILLILAACEKDFVENPVQPIETINIANSTDEVQVWETIPHSTKIVSKQSSLSFRSDAQNLEEIITINETVKFQNIDGFGFALTGGSASLINAMGTSRNVLLQELFGNGPNDIGISYLRISIGGSDLNEKPYTYNDIQLDEDLSLSQFSIENEQINLIPLLKEILIINPNIKILASPWTAPVWMKINTLGKGGFRGGSLNPIYFSVYADYFVKYINAMKDKGITIDAITVQNEPLNEWNNPSMYMSADEQVSFIKNYLGPKFENNNITTKIICYDHNLDNPDYPIQVLSDSKAYKYTNGSAFHLYAGNIGAMSKVHDKFPNKDVYFTEQWVGGPSNFIDDLKWNINNVIIGSMRNWSKTAISWNLASSPNYTPHTSGGCSSCLGGITINGNVFTRNVGYYFIGHASKFVKAGAVRIHSNTTSSINNVAFQNADGTIILIAINNQSVAKSFKVNYNDKVFTYTLNPSSVATFSWK